MDVGAGNSIAFWILGAAAAGSALGVVLVRDIFRAALLLVVTFLCVAGLFITLNADFLAVVQILIYGGGISILIVFAILLTRDVQQGNPSGKLLRPAMGLAALLLATFVTAIVNTDWRLSKSEPLDNTTTAIADLIVNVYVLAFIIAGVLLLAVMIGAIVIAKGKDED